MLQTAGLQQGPPSGAGRQMPSNGGVTVLKGVERASDGVGIAVLKGVGESVAVFGSRFVPNVGVCQPRHSPLGVPIARLQSGTKLWLASFQTRCVWVMIVDAGLLAAA